MKLTPASRAASTTARVPSRSTGVPKVVPKLLAPSPTIETSSSPTRRRSTSVGCPNRVLLGPHDRRRLPPRDDPVLGEGGRHVVVVDLGPMRVVQLVEGEARLQRVVETHVVHCL